MRKVNLPRYHGRAEFFGPDQLIENRAISGGWLAVFDH